jgi:hypothetical protein
MNLICIGKLGTGSAEGRCGAFGSEKTCDPSPSQASKTGETRRTIPVCRFLGARNARLPKQGCGFPSCVTIRHKQDSQNGCHVNPGHVLPRSRLRRLAMIVGGHKSFVTFMSSRASIYTGRRTYASFAMVLRWLAAHDWQGLCCERLSFQEPVAFLTR